MVTGPLSLGADVLATHHELIDRDGLTDVGLGGRVLPSDLAAKKSALAAWATVAAARTIVLASPRALCPGVDRAIAIVEQALRTRAKPLYVRKQIVHNRHVVGDLARRGAIFVEELDEVPDGSVVVFLLTAYPLPYARKPPNGTSTSSTALVHWSRRSIRKPAGSPPAATPLYSSGTTATRRWKAPLASLRTPLSWSSPRPMSGS